MADANGQMHTIAWWFEQPTADIMQALILAANGLITPGNPNTSKFVTRLIAPAGPMGAIFGTPAQPPNTGSCRDVVVMWIEKNCPLIDTAPKKLWLNLLRSAVDRHPTGRIRGMGAIH